jgi:hypothetical protein
VGFIHVVALSIVPIPFLPSIFELCPPGIFSISQQITVAHGMKKLHLEGVWSRSAPWRCKKCCLEMGEDSSCFSKSSQKLKSAVITKMVAPKDFCANPPNL